MDDTKRREALWKYSYRSAAAEQEPELSGMLPTQHQAMIDEEMRQRFPNELRGIEEAKAALDVAAQVWETTRIALENEIKATGASVVQAPPPEPSKPWLD